FAGGRAVATANLFYYDMRNAQRSQPIVIPAASGPLVTFANLFNVPKASCYGVEGQLLWSASDRLYATIAVGLLRTKFVETDGESAPLQGNEFDRAPHFTGSLALDWKPVPELRLS